MRRGEKEFEKESVEVENLWTSRGEEVGEEEEENPTLGEVEIKTFDGELLSRIDRHLSRDG